MKKKRAIELLGGSVKAAAKKIGVTYQAIARWPEELTPAIRDRVEAALYRELLAFGCPCDANGCATRDVGLIAKACNTRNGGECHD